MSNNNVLPCIYKYLGGKPIEIIDLSKNIPLLMEYIKAFDDATIESLKQGETTYEYGYYHDQLSEFITLHPNFNTCLIPDKELHKVLSGLYSDKFVRNNKEKKVIKDLYY
jgi:hypothetical protein